MGRWSQRCAALWIDGPVWHILFLLLLACTGCNCGGASVTPVDPAVLHAIVEFFRDREGWRFDRPGDKENRMRGFFVRRRAQHIGERNATWVTEPGQPTLRARIDAELSQVEAFARARLGTRAAPGPLGGGPDATAPAHLDLTDMGKIYVDTSARRAQRNGRRYLELRKRRVPTIIWRAAALHDEVWQPADGGRRATLLQDQLSELTDRRLRAVERMNLQISVASSRGIGPPRWRPLAHPDREWRDRFRVRMFEYPRVANSARFRNAIRSTNIAAHDEPDPPEPAPRKPWREGQTERRLEYNVDGPISVHFPPGIRDSWRHADEIIVHGRRAPYYLRELRPASGRTGAQVIDAMFTPNEDWWQRTWLWCDHAMAACNIEALLFALRRRHGSDAPFDDLVREGYVAVSAFVGGPATPARLQSDEDDRHFHNRTRTPVDELEIGDQLIFWNSFVYTQVTAGDWRLENAYVMDVDVDPANLEFRLRLDRTSLQGHGTEERFYPRYQNVILNKLESGLERVRNHITATVSPGSSTTQLTWRGMPARLVRWDPYEPFAGRGAWWVRISTGRQGDDWASPAHALDAIGKSFADLPLAERGPGYRPPPDPASVYFPLWEPRIAGGWSGYFARRRVDPSVRPPRLRETATDGSILPGLFRSRQVREIPVIKARVRRSG